MHGPSRSLLSTGGPRRCAVLGTPISHSLSPVLHRAAYQALGLDWAYEAVEVGAGELASFLDGLPAQWRGFSLTMPLKREAVALADERGPIAATTGVANTLLLDGARRIAHNTDVPGMVAALSGGGVQQVRSAVLLGGGATAASALVALTQLGARTVAVWLRDPFRGQLLVDLGRRLDVQVALHRLLDDPLPDIELTVSTIPAAAASAVATWVAERSAAVLDVAYGPEPTPLARAAEQRGRLVVSGRELLLHQAALQVELMTGRCPAPLAAMRAALESASAPPASASPAPSTGRAGPGTGSAADN